MIDLTTTEEPTFSIVIPTLNRPAMLKRALESVLSQTYSQYEVIVVDDGSSCPCDDVVRALSSDRIRLIRASRNMGQGLARNIGIAASAGQFISFLDDDDQLESTFLERSYAALAHTDDQFGFCWCSVRFVDDTNDAIDTVNGPASRVRMFKATYGTQLELYEQLLTAGIGYGFTFKSSCLRKIGSFQRRLRCVEDTDLFIRLVDSGYMPVVVSSIEVTVHNHDDRRLTGTQMLKARIRESEDLLRLYAPFFAKYPSLRNQITAHIQYLTEYQRDAIASQ